MKYYTIICTEDTTGAFSHIEGIFSSEENAIEYINNTYSNAKKLKEDNYWKYGCDWYGIYEVIMEEIH